MTRTERQPSWRSKGRRNELDGIKDQVAVVTGAAQGNGRAIALGLAHAGARVACCDVKVGMVKMLSGEIADTGGKALAIDLDVADGQRCRVVAAEVEETLGPAAILINNAGVIRRTPPDVESFAEDWDQVMAVNATGVMQVTRAFLSQLRATKGRIINLGSIMSIAAGPGIAAYAASKGAVLQLTKALAHDLAKDGVRVNAIAPGVIETPMTEVTRQNPEAIGRFMAHTPMGRPGLPEELVGPVLFLASHSSSYVTGVLLPVDGGYLAS
jgi:NAD(P)-dependent dehydrogenase (short-subunit alcohol dehydrogenase family)